MSDFLAFVLRHPVGTLTAIAALASDQLTKLLVIGTLSVGESWPVDSFIRLTHVTNSGSALHLFSVHTFAIIFIPTIGIGVLFALYWPRPRTGIRTQISFGLMFAGVVGNLIDRLFLGHVTDFIDVIPGLVFNVADASIAIGLIGFAWDLQVEASRSLSRMRLRS